MVGLHIIKPPTGQPLSSEPTDPADRKVYLEVKRVVELADGLSELFKRHETRIICVSEEDAVAKKKSEFLEFVAKKEESITRFDEAIESIICKRKAREIINDIKAEINLWKARITDITTTKIQLPEVQSLYASLSSKLANVV